MTEECWALSSADGFHFFQSWSWSTVVSTVLMEYDFRGVRSSTAPYRHSYCDKQRQSSLDQLFSEPTNLRKRAIIDRGKKKAQPWIIKGVQRNPSTVWLIHPVSISEYITLFVSITLLHKMQIQTSLQLLLLINILLFGSYTSATGNSILLRCSSSYQPSSSEGKAGKLFIIHDTHLSSRSYWAWVKRVWTYPLDAVDVVDCKLIHNDTIYKCNANTCRSETKGRTSPQTSESKSGMWGCRRKIMTLLQFLFYSRDRQTLCLG